MLKIASSLLVLSLAVFVGSCSHAPTGSTLAPDGANTFTLLYQQSRNGTLEPCGCQSAPFGGIDREFNAVEEIKKSSSRVLFVDVGGLFTAPGSKTSLEGQRAHAEAMLPMLAANGLTVFAPAASDYALGLDFLKKLEGQAKFAFIATNVVTAKGEPAFATHKIVDLSGLPVA
ncbi:hypothetical protein K2X33_13180, partial [bacterium]|nr:hypothetical protein [bacterium]